MLGIFDLCGVCGLPLDGDRFVALSHHIPDEARSITTTEPPVHPVCAAYAVQACPFLLNPAAVVRHGPAKGMNRVEYKFGRCSHTLRVDHLHHGVSFTLSPISSKYSFEELVIGYDALIATDTDDPAPPAFAPVLEFLERPDPIISLLYAAVCVSTMAPVLRLDGPGEQLRDAVRQLTADGFHAVSDEYRPALDAVNRWLDCCGDVVPGIVAASRAQRSAPERSAGNTGAGRAERVGRNDRCPCGSGMKFKHCHGQHNGS